MSDEYRKALEIARAKYIPIIESEQRGVEEERIAQRANRVLHKRLCDDLAPRIIDELKKFTVQQQAELEGLCRLWVGIEHTGFYATTVSGELVKNSEGKYLLEDSWTTGAQLFFVPELAHSVEDELSRTMCNRVTLEESPPERIRQAWFNLSTAQLRILIAGDLVLVAADFRQTKKEQDEFWLTKSPRVKALDSVAYFPSGDFSARFLQEHVLAFLTKCLSDEFTIGAQLEKSR